MHPTSPPARARRSWRVAATLAEALWPFVLLLLLWQTWITLGEVPALIAPSPAGALRSVLALGASLAPDLAASLVVIGSGLAVGMALGVLLASLAWFSPVLTGLLTPTTVLLNAMPSVALIPIVASVLGLNASTVIAIAALITFFPAFVMTRSGLDAIPPGSADVLSVLGARRWRRFLHLALPAAVPHMATALRIGAMLSVLGAMTAEWLLGTSGLGYRLAMAQQTLDIDHAWSISLLGVALSLVVFGIATSIERRMVRRFR